MAATVRQSGLGANDKQIALDNGTFRIGGTPAENWSYRPGNVGDVLNKQFRIDAGGGTFDVAEGLRFDLGVGTGPADTFTNHNLFGSGDLTKTGLGTLVLGGYHQPVGYGMKDFTGAIDVTAGTLRVGHALGLGSTDKGTTIRSGAVLSFNIDREGWTRDETYAEPVTLQAGATLQAASTRVSTLTGLITLAGNATIDVIDATAQGRLDIAGKVTGAGGFTKTGDRPLVAQQRRERLYRPGRRRRRHAAARPRRQAARHADGCRGYGRRAGGARWRGYCRRNQRCRPHERRHRRHDHRRTDHRARPPGHADDQRRQHR